MARGRAGGRLVAARRGPLGQRGHRRASIPVRGKRARPYNPESVKEAAAELERRKAYDREVALARVLSRPEPAPYVAREAPLAWREDVLYGPTIHDPISDHDLLTRAFEDAERDGMVKWYVEASSCLEEMSALLPHDATDKLPRGCRRYGVAIVRPAPYGLMAAVIDVKGDTEIEDAAETLESVTPPPEDPGAFNPGRR